MHSKMHDLAERLSLLLNNLAKYRKTHYCIRFLCMLFQSSREAKTIKWVKLNVTMHEWDDGVDALWTLSRAHLVVFFSSSWNWRVWHGRKRLACSAFHSLPLSLYLDCSRSGRRWTSPSPSLVSSAESGSWRSPQPWPEHVGGGPNKTSRFSPYRIMCFVLRDPGFTHLVGAQMHHTVIVVVSLFPNVVINSWNREHVTSK